MYDFANSAYTTTVVTAIFNACFVAVIAGGAVWATLAWTTTLVAIASFFFGSSENIIAAFLLELAGEDDLGEVSGWGWGWSWGYLGGMSCLALSLAWILAAKARGESAESFVPATMLITAAFFAVSSAPTFLLLRERVPVRPPAGGEVSVLARSLLHLLRESCQFPDMARFMVCMLCYQSGVFAAIALAAIYAQEAIGFTVEDNIKLFFVVNGTAAIGAFAFGCLQDRLGHVRTVALTLFGWLPMTAGALGSDTREQFWVAANIAAGRILRTLGSGHKTRCHRWPHDLRRHDLAFGRQSSPGAGRYRSVLRWRPAAADWHRRAARPPWRTEGFGLSAPRRRLLSSVSCAKRRPTT